MRDQSISEREKASSENISNDDSLSFTTPFLNNTNCQKLSLAPQDEIIKDSFNMNFLFDPPDLSNPVPSASDDELNSYAQVMGLTTDLHDKILCKQDFPQKHPNSIITADDNLHPPNAHIRDQEHPSRKGCKRRASNDGLNSNIRRQSLRLDQYYEVENKPNARSFACPFYKMDNEKYSDCRTNMLKRIKDVKQHVYRKHSRPHLYCPLCFRVFTGTNSRDEHIQEKSCARQPDPVYDGISEDQRNSLRHNSHRGKSVEEQWRDMWCIIFPGVDSPKSPYLGGYREEAASVVRSFWGEHKTQIISEAIKREGTCNIVYQLLDQVVDKLLEKFENEASHTTNSCGEPNSQTSQMNHLVEHQPEKQDTLRRSLSESSLSDSDWTWKQWLESPVTSPSTISPPDFYPSLEPEEIFQFQGDRCGMSLTTDMFVGFNTGQIFGLKDISVNVRQDENFLDFDVAS
ncbi:hypothetical protein F4775DRAFT_549408 [Biscogniauxia sp. FL1348]|nr:hypothetical protein F4775DRAFT_549408 [Biscogniauxia sp. FL1348]